MRARNVSAGSAAIAFTSSVARARVDLGVEGGPVLGVGDWGRGTSLFNWISGEIGCSNKKMMFYTYEHAYQHDGSETKERNRILLLAWRF